MLTALPKAQKQNPLPKEKHKLACELNLPRRSPLIIFRVQYQALFRRALFLIGPVILAPFLPGDDDVC